MTFARTISLSALLCCCVADGALAASSSKQIGQDNPLQTGSEQTAAVRVNDAIFLAYGFGNTYMLTTSAGNVIIDTSAVTRAPRAKELLQKENSGPITHIILTHAHGDHTGGVSVWQQPGTEVIAQSGQYEFLNYQERLAGFLPIATPRNSLFPSGRPVRGKVITAPGCRPPRCSMTSTSSRQVA